MDWGDYCCIQCYQGFASWCHTPHPPGPNAPTCIMTDASDFAVGGVLQQLIDGHWHPISYFSKVLKPAETRYSTFDRELLAVYLSIKHFRYFVEGRTFHVLTDHKPLVYALHTRPSKHSPRQARHLDFIAQFTSDLRHIKGTATTPADALSRIEVNALSSNTLPVIDFHYGSCAGQHHSPAVFSNFSQNWSCTTCFNRSCMSTRSLGVPSSRVRLSSLFVTSWHSGHTTSSDGPICMA